MYKFVTPGLGLFLLSLLVSYFPFWFVLHKYEKEPTDFPQDKKFLFLYFLQVAWFFGTIILEILLWAFFAKGDLSEGLAVLSMFYPSMFLLPALICAITGIYPVLESHRYYSYENYKGFAGDTVGSTEKPRLKSVGWLQSILITFLVGVSLVYVIW